MEFYNFLAGTSGIGGGSVEPKSSEYRDFPFTIDCAWVLGKKYSILHDLNELRLFMQSKIWFTYRKHFPPIGGTGPVTDKHWGCMLRCGQMIMAEALVQRHLGRGWMWNSEVADPVYLRILRMFQDKKDSPYSLHQLAQMGVSEGKNVGQWFGPNTVAQVLRKLSAYDEWSNIAVHVALDNAVIIEDIKTMCKCTTEHGEMREFQRSQYLSHEFSVLRDGCAISKKSTSQKVKWRPMLLFVPLRLGLSSLNPIYVRSLKMTFVLRQSLGIIGGKPNHALWFLGYIGNELIYLDPHTTQPCVDLDSEKADDSSFHIPYGSSRRMPFEDMDPSVALCFFFESEDDFDEWCKCVQKVLRVDDRQLLFELAPERPVHWPPLEVEPNISSCLSSLEYCFIEPEQNVNSDEDFEIFEPISPCNK